VRTGSERGREELSAGCKRRGNFIREERGKREVQLVRESARRNENLPCWEIGTLVYHLDGTIAEQCIILLHGCQHRLLWPGTSLGQGPVVF